VTEEREGRGDEKRGREEGREGKRKEKGGGERRS